MKQAVETAEQGPEPPRGPLPVLKDEGVEERKGQTEPDVQQETEAHGAASVRAY